MGVTFDETEKKFVFDFEHDGADDIVSLTGNGYQVKAFLKVLEKVGIPSMINWRI